ncbi:hypothetical protein NL676_032655 [Syzygium grande]|nr:hypothetical protein NL676_032655 [Syzygium grande]
MASGKRSLSLVYAKYVVPIILFSLSLLLIPTPAYYKARHFHSLPNAPSNDPTPRRPGPSLAIPNFCHGSRALATIKLVALKALLVFEP